MILLGEISFSKDASFITPKFSDNHSSVIFGVALSWQVSNRYNYFFKSSYIHYKSYSAILNVSSYNKKKIHIHLEP